MNKLAPHPNVLARAAGETVVLVHLDTNRIFTLNRTGSRVWALIASGHDRAQIHDMLQAQFDVDPERLSPELEALFDMLVREQLVTEGDEPVP